jgi:hypothetical protein
MYAAVRNAARLTRSSVRPVLRFPSDPRFMYCKKRACRLYLVGFKIGRLWLGFLTGLSDACSRYLGSFLHTHTTSGHYSSSSVPNEPPAASFPHVLGSVLRLRAESLFFTLPRKYDVDFFLLLLWSPACQCPALPWHYNEMNNLRDLEFPGWKKKKKRVQHNCSC